MYILVQNNEDSKMKQKKKNGFGKKLVITTICGLLCGLLTAGGLTGYSYIKYQKELLSVASPPERAIVDTFLRLKNGEAVDFSSMSEKLLAFAKKWIDKR